MGTDELWEIRRPEYDRIYVSSSYSSNPNFVSFKVHYGVHPVTKPSGELGFEGGKIGFVDFIFTLELTMTSIRKMLVELGHNVPVTQVLILEPGKTFEEGLLTVLDDIDLAPVKEWANKVEEIEVFVDTPTCQESELGDESEDEDYVPEGREFEVPVHDKGKDLDDEVNVRVEKCGKKVVINENDFDAECPSSEYANSDELRSFDSSDQEGHFKRWKDRGSGRPQFNMETDLGNPHFAVGMNFKSKEDVKIAIQAYAVKQRRMIKLKKNDKIRIRAICEGNVNCPWALQVGWSEFYKQWEVRTYTSDHLCNLNRAVKQATAGWVGKKHMEHIRENPDQKNLAFRQHVQATDGVDISKGQAYRARKAAQDLIFGNYEQHYTMLRNYLAEVVRANPGSTVKLDFEEYNEEDPTRTFKRVYMCFDALRKGFNAGCRKVLGLDCAFLKGPYPGQLLSADSQQGSQQAYRDSGIGSSRLRGRGSSTIRGRGRGRSTSRDRGRGGSISVQEGHSQPSSSTAQPLRKSPRKQLKKSYVDM